MKTAENAECKFPLLSEECGPLLRLAAVEVFEMMIGIEPQSASSRARKSAEVTAVVGVAGQLCGVFSVTCSTQAALVITGAMLGASPETVAKEAWDAVGELCNMVAGNFKAKLDGVGEHCMLSVPTVVSGTDYTVRPIANGFRTEEGFLLAGEPVWITIDLENKGH